MDLVHLDQSVCEPANHICSIVQVACLFLIQLGHSSKGVRPRGGLDHRLEGLHGCGVGLEEGDFGVATPGPLIEVLEIGWRRVDQTTYLGTSRYFRFTRPDSKLGSIQAIVPSWRSSKLPTTATPAGPAPTTTAAHFLVAMVARSYAERIRSDGKHKGTKMRGEKRV